MSDDSVRPDDRQPADAPPTPREQRVEAMARSLAPPPSDPEFRERLRDQFAGSRVAPTAPAAPPPPGRSRSAMLRPRFSRRRSILALAGALAAGIAIVALLRFNGRLHEPGVIENASPVAYDTAPGELTDDGLLLVDGLEVAVADVRAGRRRILAGQDVELRGTLPLELVWDDVLAIELVPGSRCTLPGGTGGAGDESATELHGHIARGEVRIVTGPGFSGRTLTIESDDASVHVVGTTFAVIRDSAGTCVCVEDGVTQIRSREGNQGGRVVAGRRLQLFDDFRPPVDSPIRPEEAMKLGMLRDRAGSRFVP